MAKPILCFGEILWDLLPAGPVLGGAPFNLAFRLAERGEHAIIASRVGCDELGFQARNTARELGVDTSLIQTDEGRPTGTVKITLRGGEPDYKIIRGVAYDAIEMTAAINDAATSAGCICYGTLAQREEASRHALESMLYLNLGVLTFCDINLRKECFTAATVHDSLLRADILKLNELEVKALGRLLFKEQLQPVQFAFRVLDTMSPRIVLITLGEKGVLALPGEKVPVYVPGYKVDVVDTVGSGDAFSAGFLHRYLAGDSLERACDFGCRLGALAARHAGPTARVESEQITGLHSVAGRVSDIRFEQYAK
jgi:fructokinase